MTTTTTTTPTSAARRLLSISAAATIAAVGLVALSAPAHAADASSKVWVCKYVGTPGDDEVLKAGKNPIRSAATPSTSPRTARSSSVTSSRTPRAGRSSCRSAVRTRVPNLLDDSPAGQPADHPSEAGRRRTAYGWRGQRRPRRPGRGGALVVGAALVAAEAERRRLAATRR